MAEAKKQYDYCSTQVNLPEDLASTVLDYEKTIDTKDLSAADLEDQPHITVKYGLDPGVKVADVKKVLANQSPIRLTFGKTDSFPAGDDGVPLYIAVTSTSLSKLNALLVDKLPNTETHKGYHAHATLAYLKDEAAAKKYTGKEVPGITGTSVTLSTVTFSDTSGKQTDIPLTGDTFTSNKARVNFA